MSSVPNAMPPSLWLQETPPYESLRPSETPHEADVVIVGGGLIGTSLALALAETGRRPVVLERDRLGAGASGRNGGLLLPGTAELYPRLVARWGRDRARDLWAQSLAGAQQLAAWISRYEVDCALRPEGGLHVAASAEEGARLRQMVGLLAEDGFAATWLTRQDLGAWTALDLPPDLEGACLIPGGGPLHSGRLVAGLSRAASERGARLVEGVAVTGVRQEGGAGRRLIVSALPADIRIGAEHVVLCANAWSASVLPGLMDVITPVRGQVMGTAPLQPGLFRGAWSINDGYEYLQQLPDGRLVFGGLRLQAPDHEVGYDRPELNAEIQARLGAWLKDRFPALAAADARSVPAEHHWAGIMAFTADRLPLIGPVAGTGSRLWLACGFNGHGLPFAGVPAKLINAGLAGNPLPAPAAAFDPRRFGIRLADGGIRV